MSVAGTPTLTLGYAGFIPRSLDQALEKRATCASEPVSAHMNTDHIDVGEVFVHHRVLIVPIVDKGRVTIAFART